MTGLQIAKRRAHLGLTQPELAKALGVSKPTIGRWEGMGSRKIGVRNLATIKARLASLRPKHGPGRAHEAVRAELRSIAREIPEGATLAQVRAAIDARADQLAEDIGLTEGAGFAGVIRSVMGDS